MPNIKPELQQDLWKHIRTRQGEAILILAVGGLAWTLMKNTVGSIALFISNSLYPFTYTFIHQPLHEYLPSTAITPRGLADLIFGALFSFAVYNFEKNIFYRRFHLLLKALFASVAACTFVFVSVLVSKLLKLVGIGHLSVLLLEADAQELPALLVYYYLAALVLFPLCDYIRRRLFLMP